MPPPLFTDRRRPAPGRRAPRRRYTSREYRFSLLRCAAMPQALSAFCFFPASANLRIARLFLFCSPAFSASSFCLKLRFWHIRAVFIALFAFALALACLSAPVASDSAPVSFFVSYLIAIAVFGLFQAVFMANAGGCWDNAKKIVEVDLNEKGTPLHEATVVGDTVGDPFKDTSSVAMNPIIKFTTLFGLLAMEIAISPSFRECAKIAGVVFLVIALVFVIRSFYAMRIQGNK